MKKKTDGREMNVVLVMVLDTIRAAGVLMKLMLMVIYLNSGSLRSLLSANLIIFEWSSRCDKFFVCFAEMSSDDILAKYRKQPSAPDNSNQVKEKAEPKEETDSDSSPAYDPNNLENCKAFLDAKKKLRMVLSTADFQVWYLINSTTKNDRMEKKLSIFQYI